MSIIDPVATNNATNKGNIMIFAFAAVFASLALIAALALIINEAF